MRDDIIATMFITMVITLLLFGCGYFTGKDDESIRFLRDGNGKMMVVECHGDSCVMRPVEENESNDK